MILPSGHWLPTPPSVGGHGLQMTAELADEEVFFAMPDGNRAIVKFCPLKQPKDG